MLGLGVKVLGNIEIGEGFKVGVGSVVLNDVFFYVMVVGVFVKVVGCFCCSCLCDFM